MSESDDIREFVKLAGKGEPKGERLNCNLFSPCFEAPSVEYVKWRQKNFPNVEYFFDPETGLFGSCDTRSPKTMLSADMFKRIESAWRAHQGEN